MKWCSMRQSADRGRVLPVVASIFVLVASLLLAACGVTTTQEIGGGPPRPNTSGATAVSTRPATPPPGAVRGRATFSGSGCTLSIPHSAVPPASVMVSQQHASTVAVKVGQTVGVDLAATYHWTANLSDPDHALTPIDPQGKLDMTSHTCDWRFMATSPGKVTLSFIGITQCEPPRMCPALALDLSYTLAVQS